MLQKSLNQKGFSLVELMVVVAIIGILAAIAVPQMSKFQAKARQSEAKTQLTALFTAEKAFFQEYSAYHSNFRAVGFSPEGQIRYNVGFGSAPAAGVNASAATGYNGGLTDDANFRTTKAYCGSNGTMANGCTLLTGSSSTTAADLPPSGYTISAANAFVAGASAAIYNTTQDLWSINQDKVLSNPTSGIQ